MGLHPILGVLALVLVATQAALLPETYWNSVLPNTPMPKSVSELLHPSEFMEEKGTSVQVGVNPGNRPNPLFTWKRPNPLWTWKRPNPLWNWKRPNPLWTWKRPNPLWNWKRPNPLWTWNRWAGAPRNEIDNHNPNVAVYFEEKDLHPGKTMDMYFNDENTNAAPFLPRHVANSIPFSSNKLPEIYSHFSVKPGSMEAEVLKTTLLTCEVPAMEGEEKHCATSLESMIDFATSKLGSNMSVISTEVVEKLETTRDLQKYTIVAGGVEKMGGDGKGTVVCHRANYAYAVYQCHAIQGTRAYMVSLEGDDGTKVKAVAMCHSETSGWDPNHDIFRVLKVKPGTVPVCHFLPQGHLSWFSSPPTPNSNYSSI